MVNLNTILVKSLQDVDGYYKQSDFIIDEEEYENLSPLEKRLRRLDIMRALGELRDLGCKVTNYNIDDDYYMMKYEYELHTSIRTKRNWMGIYNHMLIGAVKGIELLNNSYNPFDFSLKGLSNEVSADKSTYYEILGEIYEHYNVPGKKMNPWFRLVINLIGTITIVGGKQNMHKFIPKQASNVENDEGWLTSVVHSPNLGHSIALGYLRNGSVRHGEKLRSVNLVANTDVEVEIVSPHFLDPEGERLRV